MDAVYFGSKFGDKMIPFLKGVKIKDKLIDSSPLVAESIDFLVKNASKDTILLMDTLCFANWIYEERGEYKSLIKEKPGSSSIAVYNPTEFVSDDFDNTFLKFAKIVNEDFAKTIMIRSALPKYYIIKNQLRDVEDSKIREGIREEYKLIKQYEKTLKAKEKVVCCDISQFYFLAKPEGRMLSWFLFEKECYEDVAEWISDYLEKGFIRRAPLYEFCLKRYIKYQYKTIKYQAFERFLDLEDWVDNIVVSASREFVSKYFNDFFNLKKWTKKQDIACILDFLKNSTEFDKEFSDAIIGYLAFHFNKANDDFYRKKMFNNGIVERSLLLEIRNNVKVNQKLITKHNAGYWYALSEGYNEDTAKTWLEYREKRVSPILVDVYGSCIAGQSINEIFTGGGRAFIRNHYWFHVPMYETSKDKIEYNEELFVGRTDEMFENVKNQFDHSIRLKLLNSDAEWVLLDLYSFISVNLFLMGSYMFADTTQKIGKEIGAVNTIPWKGYMQKKLDDKAFIKNIKTWCKWIKEKYGNNIILVDFVVSRLKIGDDDVIYNAYANAGIKNEILDKARKIIFKELDCYCISFGRCFLADDTGYNSSSAVHFEFAFYEEVYKTICHIVEKKPTKKIFDKYSNVAKIDRMLRMMNMNDPKILTRFFPTPLDNIILQIPSEMIYTNKSDMIKVMDAYDNGIGLQQCFRLINNRQLYYEVEKIFNRPSIKKVDENDDIFLWLKKDYPKAEDEVIYEKYKDNLQSNTHYIAEFYDEDKLINSISITFGHGERIPKAPEKNRHFLGWKTVRRSDGYTVLVNRSGRRRTLPVEKIGKEWKQYLYPDCSYNAKGSRIEGDIVEFHAIYE